MTDTAAVEPPTKKQRIEEGLVPKPATHEQRVEEWKDQTCNINAAVMLGAEKMSFHELVEQPVHTLQGLPVSKEETMNTLGITTIKDLAEYKFASWANAVVTLADYEDEGKRKEGSTMNIDQLVTQEYEKKSLKEIATAPLSALQGVSEDAAALFMKMKIKTVTDLANWHFVKMAKAIVVMASLEETKTSAERHQETLLKRME